MSHSEADTCRKYVVPKLTDAGWEIEPHSMAEQRTFTDGRIVVAGGKVRRGKQKRADYLLRYTRDFPIAVVEAKPEYKTPSAGLGQAKDYAQTPGLKFAYSTNGRGIVGFDFTMGCNTPQYLGARLRWVRSRTGVEPDGAQATTIHGGVQGEGRLGRGRKHRSSCLRTGFALQFGWILHYKTRSGEPFFMLDLAWTQAVSLSVAVAR